MKIERVQYLPWHAETMNARNQMIGIEFTTQAFVVATAGPAVTLMIDDVPVASIGMVPVCAGTAEIWVLAAENINDYKFSFCKLALWCLEESIRRYHIYRFQAVVDKDKIDFRKWAEFLGFHVEGPALIRFGPAGETYMRYVRLIDGGSDVHR